MRRLVVGCGYLGSAAAEAWRQAGDDVYAVTRSEPRARTFSSRGWQPIMADLTKPQSLRGLPEVDTVLVAVGWDRARYPDVRQVYVDGFQELLRHLPAETRQVISISSTGVYGGQSDGWVNETTATAPTRASGVACLEAEQLLQASPFAARSVILRLAGIYGPDRVPGLKALERGDWDSLSLDGYLNLVHRDDAAQVIVEVARQRLGGELFLVSDGHPVQRQDYYRALARRMGISRMGISIPKSNETQREAERGSKRVCTEKLNLQLPLEWRYPTFEDGLSALLTEGDAVDE